jgi:hypothetical protein
MMNVRPHPGPLPHPPTLRYGAVQIYSRVEAKRRRKERENRLQRSGDAGVPVDLRHPQVDSQKTATAYQTHKFSSDVALLSLSMNPVTQPSRLRVRAASRRSEAHRAGRPENSQARTPALLDSLLPPGTPTAFPVFPV